MLLVAGPDGAIDVVGVGVGAGAGTLAPGADAGGADAVLPLPPPPQETNAIDAIIVVTTETGFFMKIPKKNLGVRNPTVRLSRLTQVW